MKIGNEEFLYGYENIKRKYDYIKEIKWLNVTSARIVRELVARGYYFWKEGYIYNFEWDAFNDYREIKKIIAKERENRS